MIRVVLFFVLIGLFALGVAWLADRPGDVAITWQGWRIETSVLFAVAAIAALVVLTTVLWSFLRGVLRAPHRLSVLLRDRRNRRGQLAVSHGLVAVAAGDARAARRFAQEAERRRRASRSRSCSTRRPRSSPATARRPNGVSRHGAADRHQSWPAWIVHRGAASRRHQRGPRLCGRGGEACARIGLGRTGGARIPLCHRRLGRRAGRAREQPAQRPVDKAARSGSVRCCSPRGRWRKRATIARAPSRSRWRRRSWRPRLSRRRRWPAAAGRDRATAQGEPDHRNRMGGQSASRPRRDLLAPQAGGFRARAADTHARAGGKTPGNVEGALAIARAAIDAHDSPKRAVRGPLAITPRNASPC